MSIGSIMSNGMQGIQSGMNRTAISAGRIAGGISEDPEAATTLVGLSQGAIDSKISASVVKTGDELLGTLINIHA